MRLLSLHVENFGTLSGVDEHFEDGLNVRLHPNGYGKSTLAVFIKSMLYGLPATRSRSLIENERKRYTPWQSGVFGGSLDIEVGGEAYRIERTFGNKESDDTLCVLSLRTGAIVRDDWATAPGERLLGVGIAAYERSTYLSQRPDEMTKSGVADVHQKLNRLADEADDLGRFDAAMAALDHRRQYYSLINRHGGAIDDTTDAIAALDARIDACRAAREELARSHERADNARAVIDSHRQALKELEARERTLYQAREARAVADRLDSLRREESALREQIETMRRSLGGAVPTEQSIASLELLLGRRDELLARSTSHAMSEGEREELSRLRSRYGATPLTAALTDELRAAADQLHRATVDAIAADDLLLSTDPQGKTPEQLLLECRRTHALRQQEYDRLVEEKEALRAQLTRRKPPVIPLALVVLSVAVTLGGLLASPLFAVGGALGAVSIVLLLVTVARRAARQKDDEARLVGVNHELSHAEQLLNGTKTSLIAAEYGASFAQLWRAHFPSLPCPYGLDAPSEVRRLAAEIARLDELSARERTALTARDQASDELSRVDQAIREMLAPMPDAPEDARRALLWLTELRGRLVDCSERYLHKQNEIRALCEQHGLSDEAPLATPDAADEATLAREREALRQELESWSQALTRELQNGERLLAEAEGEPEAVSERERLEALLVDQKAALDAILAAQTYLKQAREQLSGRYLATVKERFSHYMSCLTGKDAPELTMDGQFHVTLRAGGVGRTTEAFSVGLRDLIALCERLALLDAMFEGERPFLVLDDPFTNMDDDTIARAHALLCTVSERYQILYLTCHTGRVPTEA